MWAVENYVKINYSNLVREEIPIYIQSGFNSKLAFNISLLLQN